MPVTVTVFVAAGLKRGDPINSAVFSVWSWSPERKAWVSSGWLRPLQQNGNVYVLEPFAPLGPTEVELTVYNRYPDQREPMTPRAVGVSVRQGDTVEVWV